MENIKKAMCHVPRFIVYIIFIIFVIFVVFASI